MSREIEKMGLTKFQICGTIGFQNVYRRFFMNENSKSKIIHILDAMGGFLPYMMTVVFPFCFAMVMTFAVKTAGTENSFMTALGFFGCFGIPVMWADAGKIALERLEHSKWKIPFVALAVICLLLAVVFGVVFANRFDLILAKM